MPFWQGLLNAGEFSSPEFSFYLTRERNNSFARDVEPGGVLTLGGTNRSLYRGEIEFMDMPAGYTPAFWVLRMTSGLYVFSS
jgi:cathepsin D